MEEHLTAFHLSIEQISKMLFKPDILSATGKHWHQVYSVTLIELRFKTLNSPVGHIIYVDNNVALDVW